MYQSSSEQGISHNSSVANQKRKVAHIDSFLSPLIIISHLYYIYIHSSVPLMPELPA